MTKSPVLYTFNLVMTSMYVLLGLFLMLSPDMASFLPGWKHWILGILTILYAAMRFKRLRSIKRNLESDETA